VSRHEPINVLVADHNRWARLTMSTMLTEAGFAVEEASNGMSALRIVAAAPPHIVLLGQALPELDAPEFVRTLHTDPRTRHVAVVQLGPDDRGVEVDGRCELSSNSVEVLATVICALETRRARLRRHSVRAVRIPASQPSVTRVRRALPSAKTISR
jgi:CheY-like chemotaxis protein